MLIRELYVKWFTMLFFCIYTVMCIGSVSTINVLVTGYRK